MSLEKNKASICIVNYKTERLTRICLRSIRKFTQYPYEIIVVDNDSNDSSLEYLKSLKWIRLIERKGEAIRPGSWAHGSGLDMGLEQCKTEFFIAMHSDVVIRKENWLAELANLANTDTNIACVGAGKIEHRSPFEAFIKKITDVKALARKISGNNRDKFYIRAICSLYRTEILRKENLRFAMDAENGQTCGRKIYFELIRRGYKTLAIPDKNMAEKVFHLAHATMVINPEFKVRKRTQKKCLSEMKRLFESPLVKELEEDNTLDS